MASKREIRRSRWPRRPRVCQSASCKLHHPHYFTGRKAHGDVSPSDLACIAERGERKAQDDRAGWAEGAVEGFVAAIQQLQAHAIVLVDEADVRLTPGVAIQDRIDGR